MSVKTLLIAFPDDPATPAPEGRSPAAPAGPETAGDVAGGFRSVLRRSLEKGTPTATPDGAAPPDGVPEGSDVPPAGDGDTRGSANATPLLTMALVSGLLTGPVPVPAPGPVSGLPSSAPGGAAEALPASAGGGAGSALGAAGSPLVPVSGPLPDGTSPGTAEAGAPQQIAGAGDVPQQAATSPPHGLAVTPASAGRIASAPVTPAARSVLAAAGSGRTSRNAAITTAVPAPVADGEARDPEEGPRPQTAPPAGDGQAAQAGGAPELRAGRVTGGPPEMPAGRPGDDAGDVLQPVPKPQPAAQPELPAAALRRAEAASRAVRPDEAGGQVAEVDTADTTSRPRQHAGTPTLVNGPESPQAGSGQVAAPMTWREALSAAHLPRQVADAVREAHLRAEAGGPAEMRVRLEPPHLGEVTVRLTLHEGVVRAVILVARPEVKAALDSQMGDLRQRLEQQGLEVGAFHVGVGGGDARSRDPGAMPQTRWPRDGRGVAWKEAERVGSVRSAPDPVPSLYPRWRLGHRLDRIV